MKINPAGLSSLHQTTNHTPPTKDTTVSTAASYDTINIQPDNRDASFRKSLEASIGAEVRREASARKLADLTARIQNGTYHPDASAIADKILLEGIIPREETEDDHE